jgi:CheY-like chemotaxis protein
MPGKLEVLLIEDNREAAALVEHMLATAESSSAPIRIEWVDTLAKALTRLQETAFDAILLDLNLPDSRGLETFSNDHSPATADAAALWLYPPARNRDHSALSMNFGAESDPA